MLKSPPRHTEPLHGWTTLRLGGPAERLVEAGTRDDLYRTVADADARGVPVLVLGGGSNLVVADEGFAGLAVHVASCGVVVEDGPASKGRVRVTAEAGESWDPLVARAVANGWAGVEALSGIPGLVGAVPIQNVGAYGQEVSQTLVAVHAFDRSTRTEVLLSSDECGFGYRTSRFKAEPTRFVIGAATFRLDKNPSEGVVRYAEVARALGVDMGATAPIAAVRDAVLALRVRKGMVLDPSDHDTWSAGSFFTNPIVDESLIPQAAPHYPQPDGRVKTSAAWLIEHAGLARGHGNERVRISTKHTLALTNRGGASTADLLALAREVRDRVRDVFAIDLVPEPTLVNCAL